MTESLIHEAFTQSGRWRADRGRGQTIIQASWNWPLSRKDLEVYGQTGYVQALDGRNLRQRKQGASAEQSLVLEPKTAPLDDPFAYLAAVVCGEIKVADNDLSALANNVTVMRILEAAKESAATGKTVTLAAQRRQ